MRDNCFVCLHDQSPRVIESRDGRSLRKFSSSVLWNVSDDSDENEKSFAVKVVSFGRSLYELISRDFKRFQEGGRFQDLRKNPPLKNNSSV